MDLKLHPSNLHPSKCTVRSIAKTLFFGRYKTFVLILSINKSNLYQIAQFQPTSKHSTFINASDAKGIGCSVYECDIDFISFFHCSQFIITKSWCNHPEPNWGRARRYSSNIISVFKTAAQIFPDSYIMVHQPLNWREDDCSSCMSWVITRTTTLWC